MLFKNDIFSLNEHRFRLLHAQPETDKAWLMSLDDDQAWPVAVSWSSIRDLCALPADSAASANSATNAPSEAMRRARDEALRLLGDLPSQIPAIFDAYVRGPLVKARCEAAGCAPKTIYKHLRRYWVGGQTPAALLGTFYACGRRDTSVTGGRGAKPTFDHETYQLATDDISRFAKVIEKHYLTDARATIPSTFQHLLEQFYQTIDGNGKPWVRPQGERPSLRQFEYFLRKTYPLELRLRKRHGDKDFERDHRPILGTVLADCQGVGHYYEADATIADVYLVAEEDSNQIVGKPTIYLIIDRKSRLIVGWYVGLENPSWVCAMQALFSISQDKRELCSRYGVAYDPNDWPAHEVFPKQVLGDRGELFTRASNQLADELAVTVTNVPSKRGDWKPVVECGFKLTRMTLQDGTPGFDPPENAKRRQGKHYEKDACLTLKQFIAIILLAIIEHNRRPMREYQLSLKELAHGVRPTPLDVWNHDIVDRAGLLPRFSEETVRMALLPRGEATVTEEGIVFGQCHYTCPEAIAKGWFVQARKKRFKTLVTYDGRLVDTLYVHHPQRAGEVFRCTLTPRSEQYAGYSLAEVEAFARLRRMLQPSIEQGRLQVRADYHAAVEPIIATAKARLKAAGSKASRTARRADIKAARSDELRSERQSLASSQPTSQRDLGPQEGRRESAVVVPLVTAQRPALHGAPLGSLTPQRTSPVATSASVSALTHAPTQAEDSTAEPAAKALTLAERARLARQRMMHG